MDDGCFAGLVKKAIYADSTNAYNTFLYKIDPLGDTTSIMFSKVDTIFNFYYLDRLTTDPSGFLLTGWGIETGGSPNNRFTIIRRINDDFELVWEKIYDFNYYYGAYRSCIMELINGDIIYSCSPNLNLYMFIMRLSSQGDSLDFASYSGSDAGEVWGMTYNYDSTEMWLNTIWAHYPGGGYATRLNDTLGVEYEKYIGGDYYYWLSSVTAASDGGVLIAGTFQEIAQTTLNRNALILKFDSTGCITNTPDDKRIEISDAIIYPNPGNEIINIRTALTGCLFSLFDIWGQTILTTPVSEFITTVNVNSLKRGNYYYSVTRDNETIISGTWIKY